jgi:hypothetical protein
VTSGESGLEFDIFAGKKHIDDRWKQFLPREVDMRPHPIWVTALALLLYTETSAIAQGTDQQREACTPDVFRLCGAYIPDVDRITACLRGNGSRLSRPCYDVFFPPQDVNSRRRFQGRPYPPDYNDD